MERGKVWDVLFVKVCGVQKELHWTMDVPIGVMLGLYWDNGKENGNYRDYRDYIGIVL